MSRINSYTEKNILILSNCAASKAESNGRIHMTHFSRFNKIHNFYLTGMPDCDDINYLTVSLKRATISKFFLNSLKQTLIFGKRSTAGKYKNKITITPFIHLIRNFIFSKNKKIIKLLENYIIENKINFLVLWGCNVPFLYEYTLVLSKKLGIPYITITSEDYPLKKYNYINRKKTICFNLFQKQLFNDCKSVYLNSKWNIYTNEDLEEAYKKEIGCVNNKIIYFASELTPAHHKSKEITTITYGGKLYEDRILSLLDIALVLKNSKILIKVFGEISEKDKYRFKDLTNVKFYGHIPYNKLKEELYKSDALLHIEGFSDYYKKDCKYAFSTKIADYIMLSKPFVVYGPKELSGVKFYLKKQPDWCFTSKKDLEILPKILSENLYIPVDLSDLFSVSNVSLEIMNLIND